MPVQTKERLEQQKVGHVLRPSTGQVVAMYGADVCDRVRIKVLARSVASMNDQVWVKFEPSITF
jgi:hypothetical protein